MRHHRRSRTVAFVVSVIAGALMWGAAANEAGDRVENMARCVFPSAEERC